MRECCKLFLRQCGYYYYSVIKHPECFWPFVCRKCGGFVLADEIKTFLDWIHWIQSVCYSRLAAFFLSVPTDRNIS